MEEYLTVKNTARTEVVIERSRFISTIARVETADEAKAFVDSVKKEFPDATHNCYAYITERGGYSRYSDDGEPSGTAGAPILEVIKGANLFDTAIVVTRYFGGVKLGTGGLVRAYTESAQLALANAQTAELVPLTRFTLALPYIHYENARRKVPEVAVEIVSEEFAAAVTLAGTVPSANFAAFADLIRDLTGGAATPVAQEMR